VGAIGRGVQAGAQKFQEGLDSIREKLQSLQVGSKTEAAVAPAVASGAAGAAAAKAGKASTGGKSGTDATAETEKELNAFKEAAKVGFREMWEDFFNTSLSGSERIKKVWLSMKNTFAQVTAENILNKKKEAFEFIALEGKKTAIFLANSAKRAAALAAEISKKLASAAASIAEAAAEAIKDAIGFLGPFGVPAAIAAGVAIATQWSKIKGMLGFQFGGLVPEPAFAGISGRDRTPILAEPGEFVIRKEVVQQVGVGALARLNQSGSLPGAAINVHGDTIIIQGGIDDELLSEIRNIKERSREQLKKDIEFLIKRRRLKL
ncbi:MAG: hypothetical protein D6814_16665, partial [Calditrichaeota bacterium]